MRVFLANDYPEKTTGGGFVFAHNFAKTMRSIGHEIVDSFTDADVLLIPGPTMLNDKELFDAMVAIGKPIVLRVDNAVRDSRNRGSGMSRLVKYASAAHAVVYQSQWAKNLLDPFLKKHCKGAWSAQRMVILNGVDTSIFRKEGETIRRNRREPIFIYSRHNRDELKGWQVAWYWYINIARHYHKPALWILGRFDEELVRYNFDFFDGEVVVYFGDVTDREEYAKILRSGDIFLAPYDFDACSNAVLEARASGLKILTREDPTGGMQEVLDPKLDLGLERMAKEYHELFASLLKR